MTKLPLLLDNSFNIIKQLHPERMQIIKQSFPINSTMFEVVIDESPNIGNWLRVYSPAGDEGIYRVTRVVKNIGQGDTCTIYAEHAISTLNDDFIPETQDIIDKSVQSQLSAIIAKQTNKLWKLGTCAIKSTQSYVMQKSTLLQAFMALVQAYGVDYMLTFDFSRTPWKVNIVKVEENPSCECRLSRNLQSVKISIDRTDMANKLYLTGMTDEKGKPKSPVEFVKDDASIRKWGTISAEYTDAYAKDDATLRANANYYLQRSKNPIIAIQMDAVDLSALTGEALDHFECGRKCRVALPDYGTTEIELITGVAYADVFNDDAKVTLTLANRLQDASTGLTKLQNKRSSGSRGSGASNKETELALQRFLQARELIEISVFGDEEGSIASQIKLNRDNISMKVGYTDITIEDGKMTIRNSQGKDVVLDVPSIITARINTRFLDSVISNMDKINTKMIGCSGTGTFVTVDATNVNPVHLSVPTTGDATFSGTTSLAKVNNFHLVDANGTNRTVTWKSQTVVTKVDFSLYSAPTTTINYLGR